jgi:hypothetical protein
MRIEPAQVSAFAVHAVAPLHAVRAKAMALSPTAAAGAVRVAAVSA